MLFTHRITLFSVLFIFLFQTIIFNAFLFAGIVAAKIEANEFKEGTTQLVFNEIQYKKVKWLNKGEFTFNDNLYDVKEIIQENSNTILVCKQDAKEKDVLEKLVEYFKHTKSKKVISFSSYIGIDNNTEHITFHLKKENLLHKKHISSFPLKASIDKVAPPPKA